MRRLALVVLAVTLASCGSTAQTGRSAQAGSGGVMADSTTGDAAGIAPTDDAAPTASGAPSAGGAAPRPGAAGAANVAPSASAGAVPAGGSRITDPIKLGFINTAVGNAEALGVNAGQTYSPRQIFEALVAAINDDGGLAGRQVEPVIANTDTASNNWEVDFAAACERFTRDDPVEAVLGYAFVFYDSFERCLSKAGVPHLNGGYNLGDDTTFSQYPLLVGTTNVTADRRYVLQLRGGVDAGLLTRKSKVGLMLDDCPYSVRAHERSTKPYIERAGINVVATATMSCANGAGDAGGIAAQIQNAMLQFRSRGVDTVVIEGVPLVVFSQTAESQNWHPRYLLTSTSGGAAVEPNVPAAQAQNMYGFGWFPSADVDPSNQPALTAAGKRCFALLARRGLELSQYNDFVAATTSCDALFLYEAALTATRGNSDGSAIAAAITSLGEQYSGVSAHDGRTFFSPERRDAPARYRRWLWKKECSCFRYEGPPLPF